MSLPIERILSDYSDPGGRIMIAAHRGHWRRASENSLNAVRAAIAAGADIVEPDIRKTKDGELVLMHDETVDRMTNGTGKIAELAYQDIRALRLKRGRGGDGAPESDETVPTLREAMLLAKDSVLVNLDKCWDIREDVYRVLAETGTVKQGLFKNGAGFEETEAFLNGKPERPHFIQRIRDYAFSADSRQSLAGVGELERMAGDPAELLKRIPEPNAHLLERLDLLTDRVGPSAVELNFASDRSPIVSEEMLRRLKEHGLRVWVNAMFAWDCGGHTDEASLSNAVNGWDWHTARGANLILTDYPEELYAHLNAGNRQ